MANTADPRELTRLTASIKADHRSAQVRLVLLNIRELIPSLLMFGYFGYFAVTEDSAAVLYLSSLLCLGIGLTLVGSSIRQHRIEQQFDTTLRGTVERSLSQAQHRFMAYRTAGWWYVAPFAVAMFIFFGWVIADDPNGAKPGDAAAIVFALAIFAGVTWWSRRVAFTKWQPEVERFEALLADLDE